MPEVSSWTLAEQLALCLGKARSLSYAAVAASLNFVKGSKMSGWTYKQRKLRDKIRAEFKAETGKEFTHKDFISWLLDKGYITKA